MNQQPDIVEKVRKLLALSTSSNIHEAANAAAVANKYITQYRLKEEDYAQQQVEPTTNEIVFDDPDPIYVSARVIPWKMQLACILAQHYGCAIWNDKKYNVGDNKRSVSRYRLIGRPTDVSFVRAMFDWLVQGISQYSEAECRGRGHATANSYCLGAVRGIHNLFQEARDNVVAKAALAGRSTSIVRLNNREQEAQQYLATKYHLIQAPDPKPKFNPDAFERGFDIGTTLGTSTIQKD